MLVDGTYHMTDGRFVLHSSLVEGGFDLHMVPMRRDSGHSGHFASFTTSETCHGHIQRKTLAAIRQMFFPPVFGRSLSLQSTKYIGGRGLRGTIRNPFH